MPIADFPGLEPFSLSADQMADIQARFALVLSDARLTIVSKQDISAAAASVQNGPGVYFWMMGAGGQNYRIYVGKTKSLARRVSDYMKDFQAHSPNDYKIRVFQQTILEKYPEAQFRLYFAAASLEKYTQIENELILRLDPLLNRRASTGAGARESFRKAFEAYYRAGFEDILTRPCIVP